MPKFIHKLSTGGKVDLVDVIRLFHSINKSY